MNLAVIAGVFWPGFKWQGLAKVKEVSQKFNCTVLYGINKKNVLSRASGYLILIGISFS